MSANIKPDVQSDRLPEDDRETLRAHSFSISNHLSHNAWLEMNDVFRSADLSTLTQTASFNRRLPGVDPSPIDCCVNSCIAFADDLADAGEVSYLRGTSLYHLSVRPKATRQR